MLGNGSSCAEEEEGARVEEIQEHAVHVGGLVEDDRQAVFGGGILRLRMKGKARIVVGGGRRVWCVPPGLSCQY